jgi:hypothetical protein
MGIQRGTSRLRVDDITRRTNDVSFKDDFMYRLTIEAVVGLLRCVNAV